MDGSNPVVTKIQDSEEVTPHHHHRLLPRPLTRNLPGKLAPAVGVREAAITTDLGSGQEWDWELPLDICFHDHGRTIAIQGGSAAVVLLIIITINNLIVVVHRGDSPRHQGVIRRRGGLHQAAAAAGPLQHEHRTGEPPEDNK